MPKTIDPSTIQAALLGYQQQLEFIDSRIDALRKQLARYGVGVSASAVPVRKHHVSPEGRARIAEAQRRRWAAAKKAARKPKAARAGQ